MLTSDKHWTCASQESDHTYTCDTARPSLSVLVVDDDPDGAEVLAELVEHWGHRVIVAHDGLEAMLIAERTQPDAALLDISLPRLDGYEVARRLRRNSTTRDTLLIALTGYGNQTDRKKALEAGFDQHIVKPADLETLRSALLWRAGH